MTPPVLGSNSPDQGCVTGYTQKILFLTTGATLYIVLLLKYVKFRIDRKKADKWIIENGFNVFQLVIASSIMLNSFKYSVLGVVVGSIFFTGVICLTKLV